MNRNTSELRKAIGRTKNLPLLITIFLASVTGSFAQDLDALLDEYSPDASLSYTLATFRATTVVNGQSVEVPGAGDLHFKLSHRFGDLTDNGFYDLFGWDQNTMRIGFEYGIADMASISIGRNSWDKTYDGALKYRLFRQQNGKGGMPLSLSVYTVMYANALRWDDPDRENLLSSRFSYNTQLLLARKMGDRISLQLSPSYIHKNLVATSDDQNNIFATGISGSYKFARKFSANIEYFYLLPGKTADEFNNALTFSVEVETGGHMFQLLLSNSPYTYDRMYIAENTGSWLDGDIYLGFNLYRIFPLSKKRKNMNR